MNRLLCLFGLAVVTVTLLSPDTRRAAAQKPPVATPAAPAAEKTTAEKLDPPDALREYVSKPDAAYKYTVRRRWGSGDAKGLEVIMTSQSWHDTTWKHQVFLYKPAKIRSNSQALLLVDGGAWKDELEAPAKEGEDLPGNAKLLLSAADMLQAPIVVVRQVPQQPRLPGLPGRRRQRCRHRGRSSGHWYGRRLCSVSQRRHACERQRYYAQRPGHLRVGG